MHRNCARSLQNFPVLLPSSPRLHCRIAKPRTQSRNLKQEQARIAALNELDRGKHAGRDSRRCSPFEVWFRPHNELQHPASRDLCMAKLRRLIFRDMKSSPSAANCKRNAISLIYHDRYCFCNHYVRFYRALGASASRAHQWQFSYDAVQYIATYAAIRRVHKLQSKAAPSSSRPAGLAGFIRTEIDSRLPIAVSLCTEGKLKA